MNYDVQAVKWAAQGRWPGVLVSSGINPKFLTGKHGPCPSPLCGGVDRFRFTDEEGNGGFVCNRGGGLLTGDGLALLMHAHDWTFPEALTWVGEHLGVQPKDRPKAGLNGNKPLNATTLALTPESRRDPEKAKAWAKSVSTWENAISEIHQIKTHPYLTAKGISPHGEIRLAGDRLLLPVRGIDGTLRGIESIGPSGEKIALPGSIKSGGFLLLGELNPEGSLFLSEGYATGASIYQSTGETVAICFGANNLLPVAEALRAKHSSLGIIFAADNDLHQPANPGLTAATTAAAEVGGAVTTPVFEGGPEGFKDFNDLFVFQGPEEVARQLAQRETPVKAPLNDTPQPATWPGVPSEGEGPLDLSKVILDFSELLEAELPERRMILPWLPEGGLAMVFGLRGLGKTYFGLALAAAAAQGSSCMRWAITEPRGVLFIDGEMPLGSIRDRLRGFIQTPLTTPLFTLSHENFFQHYGRDLVISEPETQQAVLDLLDTNETIRLIVIDNLSSLSRIREDKSDDWRHCMLPFLIACRRRGVAVVMVHHAGKGGDQRGTGAREDQLDTSIKLTLPEGAEYGKSGCFFRVDFTKARGCFGGDIEPFTAKLQSDPAGRSVWSLASIEEGDKDRLIRLIAKAGEEGIAVNKAAEALNLPNHTVSRLRKRLDSEGVIQTSSKHKSPMIMAVNWLEKPHEF